MLDLSKATFCVIGNLELVSLPQVLTALGARAAPAPAPGLTLALLGKKRAAGRAAGVAQVRKLNDKGEHIELLREEVLVERLLPRNTQKVLGEWRAGGAALAQWNGVVQALWRYIFPIELMRVALAGAPLRGLELHQGNLSFAALSRADLTGACLTSTQARYAHLDGAALAGATLLDVQLDGADLAGANLTGATFVGSLHDADLTGATLDGAVVRGNLHGTCLQGASLRGADLAGCDLTGADLTGADFTGACLDDARMDAMPATGPFTGRAPPPIGPGLLLRLLDRHLERDRMERALEMLRAETHQLYSQVDRRSVSGVIRSQSAESKLYLCRLDESGEYCCCDNDFEPCMGTQGRLCKHIILLVVGLVQSGALPFTSAYRWVHAARAHAPGLDMRVVEHALGLYRLAQQGQVDWRPVETIPEDYYAI